MGCRGVISLWPFRVDWLVGCFGFNGPLRQYFSLYQAISQREGEIEEKIEESKNVQTTPTRTYCKRSRPLPYCHPNCRTPGTWKFTQDHRTTRPPPFRADGCLIRHWKDKKARISLVIFLLNLNTRSFRILLRLWCSLSG